MNVKRYLLAALACFVILNAVGFVVYGKMLEGAFQATESVWRPKAEMDAMMCLLTLWQAVFALTFTCIFTHGRKGTGLGEGLRFGVLMGLFYPLSNALMLYWILPIPASLAASMGVADFAMAALCGLAVAAIYKPKDAA